MATVKYKNSRNKGDIALPNLDTETQDIIQPMIKTGLNKNDVFSQKPFKANSEVI